MAAGSSDGTLAAGSFVPGQPHIPIPPLHLMKMLVDLRYKVIDVLESGRGSLVAGIIILAIWGSLAMRFLLWGVFLGWIPAAVLAIYIGHRCR